MSGKLEKWRNKSEQEKHVISVVGSALLTSLVVIIWGYTLFNTLGTSAEMAKSAEYNEKFSPLASVKSLFSENVQKIKDGSSVVKDSAAVMLGATGTD